MYVGLYSFASALRMGGGVGLHYSLIISLKEVHWGYYVFAHNFWYGFFKIVQFNLGSMGNVSGSQHTVSKMYFVPPPLPYPPPQACRHIVPRSGALPFITKLPPHPNIVSNTPCCVTLMAKYRTAGAITQI